MGPLSSVKVVELAGIGPAPYCGMLFADLGAEVVRVVHPDREARGLLDLDARFDLLNRGRKTVALDLKKSAGREIVLRLASQADALIEGFRPGVCERLGVGPDDCFAMNRKLVFGRMTGWGQSGPLSQVAGHDINYLAISGALHSIGRRGQAPTVPLNLVADFGGGGLFLAFGVLAAVVEARTSGRGQVVDAAMLDGVSSLMTMVHGMHAANRWVCRRGANLLDSGAPFYDVYETKDGEFVAVGALEPAFFKVLVRELGLDQLLDVEHTDPTNWPTIRKELESTFRTRTRAEWCTRLEHTEACVSPVLSIEEAPGHPHVKARGVYETVDGVSHPRPTPRFSRTASDGPVSAALKTGADDLLERIGYSPTQIRQLRERGVVL